MFTGGLLPVSLLALTASSPIAPIAHPSYAASGTEVVGAFPTPPTGSGPGTLAAWFLHPPTTQVGYYGQPNTTSGNSFYVGYSAATHSIYVPTAAGTTYTLNSSTLQTTGSFPTIPGGRIVRLVPSQHRLLVLSGTALAAYSLNTHQELFQDSSLGGNALITNPTGQIAYVGGNMDSVITAVDVSTGQVLQTYPVPQVGDMVWAHGQIFAADIKTGVMTALNPLANTTVAMPTPEVDPQFSYSDIPAATAGFMQVTKGPHHNTVYATGFSGHILKFSAVQDKYLGEVAVNANPSSTGGNKLSGIAILPGGNQALVTVENLGESVTVDLSNGAITKTTLNLASNRWVVIP